LHLVEFWLKLLVLLLLSISSIVIATTTASPSISHEQNLPLLQVFNTQHTQTRTIREKWWRRLEGGDVNPRVTPFCTRTFPPWWFGRIRRNMPQLSVEAFHLVHL
jgi:hypothetical protein